MLVVCTRSFQNDHTIKAEISQSDLVSYIFESLPATSTDFRGKEIKILFGCWIVSAEVIT